MWFMVKSLQRLIFRNGGSTSIVLRTVIYQRDKFVQCYEASSSCYMYLASKVAGNMMGQRERGEREGGRGRERGRVLDG